jgi:hypothetical protein
VNPKLRKVRGALDVVGLPSDLLLRHGGHRVVYGVPLAANFRQVLLGLTERAQSIVPRSDHTATAVAAFWRRRWLAPRVMRTEVREAVRTHTLVYPVTHGARVLLPPVAGEEGPLFAAVTPDAAEVTQAAR